MSRIKNYLGNTKVIVISCVVLLLFYVGVILYFKHQYPGGDPDRWYHYAISRIVAKQGIINTLPQVEDLGWNKYFPEKEFLFHAYTTLAYRVGGEVGVDFSAYFIGFSIFLVLLLFCGPRTGWVRSALVIIGLGLLNPFLSPRMTFVRPHLLAILSFILLIIGITSRRKWMSAGASALFALSYHAFFVPLIPLWISIAIFWWEKDESGKRSALYGCVGLLTGYVMTPYFPGNLVLGFEHLKIALFYSRSEPGVTPGGELLPLSIAQYLVAFWPDLLALITTTGLGIATYKSSPSEENHALKILILSAAVFWMMTIQSPRGCEYAVPATILAFLLAVGRWKNSIVIRLIVGAIFVFPLGYMAHLAHSEAARDLLHGPYYDSIFEGLKTIPLTPSKTDNRTKVLNCDWTFGSMILYARPDLAFVDILDPRLLEFASPKKFELLRKAKLGAVSDMAELMRIFDANYVICDEPLFNQAVEHDHRFQRVYEPTPVMVDGKKFFSTVRVYSFASGTQ